VSVCVSVFLHAPSMGNLCACLLPKPVKKKKPTKRLANQPPLASNPSNRWTRIRSSRKEKFDDALIQEQALAAATILLQQHNGALPFDRSASLRYPNSGSKKSNQLPRSSSSRARSLTDPLLQPQQLVNQVWICGFFYSFFGSYRIGWCSWNLE
jgi:hypothetical protein